jgi:hypothetical protein
LKIFLYIRRRRVERLWIARGQHYALNTRALRPRLNLNYFQVKDCAYLTPWTGAASEKPLSFNFAANIIIAYESYRISPLNY